MFLDQRYRHLQQCIYTTSYVKYIDNSSTITFVHLYTTSPDSKHAHDNERRAKMNNKKVKDLEVDEQGEYNNNV